MTKLDMDKLNKALVYVDRIADGKNPVNNTPTDDAVLNDPNVIRCMFFIKEALTAIKENDGVVGKVTKIKKKDFPIEVVTGFRFVETKTITRITDQINELIDPNEYKKLQYRVITSWLKKHEYLIEVDDAQMGKKVTLSTDKGNDIGITHSLQTSSSGNSYYRVEYDKTAQEFIIENLTEMIREYNE